MFLAYNNICNNKYLKVYLSVFEFKDFVKTVPQTSLIKIKAPSQLDRLANPTLYFVQYSKYLLYLYIYIIYITVLKLLF